MTSFARSILAPGKASFSTVSGARPRRPLPGLSPRSAFPPGGGRSASTSSARSILSHLFRIRHSGLSATPSSSQRGAHRVDRGSPGPGRPRLRPAGSRWPGRISSRVARKPATRSGGRSRMKPTVSVTITSRSRGKRSRREVGSKRGEELVLGLDLTVRQPVQAASTCPRSCSRRSRAPGAPRGLRRARCVARLACHSLQILFRSCLMRSRELGADRLRAWSRPDRGRRCHPSRRLIDSPLPDQARQRVFQLRQLNLQPAVTSAARAERRCRGSTGCGSTMRSSTRSVMCRTCEGERSRSNNTSVAPR